MLKRRSDFQRVYRTGRSWANRYFVLYVFESEVLEGKVGFAAGKKLGCAVVRNHVKRLMREVFRKHKAELKKGYHIVWVARRKLTKADYKTFERVFLRLAKRAALLQE